jgi:anti-anti-sigma factor
LEIVKQRSGDYLDVRVSGRLDNHWSTPFDEAIEEMIREGAHHLRVDLTGVTYLSSAGIGALMKAYSDTTNLQGSFVISAASDRVRTVLKMVALEGLLFGDELLEEAAKPREKAAKPADAVQLESKRALFECHTLAQTRCEWQLVGDPSQLGTGFTEATRIAATADVFALGVGALGHSFDDCRGLFGEFIAAAGTAAYMPTDGTSTPDYMMRSGELVPDIQALYAIVFRGSPSHLLRFDATAAGTVPLSEIVNVCANVAGTPQFGIVMAAEVFGLICTMLRKSPADPARLDYPAVREWLSYLPEHEHARSSSIVVGVASKEASPFLRPVTDEHHGHFHAAVTAFRSLPRGRVEMADVLAQAFQPRSVLSVVHLLRDDRPIEGGGESEFLRGACWVFPIGEPIGEPS